MIPVMGFLFLLGMYKMFKWFILPGSGGNRGSEGKPNVVLIIIDALRADKLGCYGCELGLSGEIDVLASQGVVFERVTAQCSWTRPSTASMLTGLYPRSTGIFKESFDILADHYLTLPEILKSNGYRTYGITANPNLNAVFNFHQGFDEYRDSGVTWKWMKPIGDKKEGEQTPGQEDSEDLPRSRDIFAEVIKKARSSGEGPFYIQINIMEVHSPHLARNEYKERFKDYEVKRVNFDYPEKKLAALVQGTLGAVQQASYDVGWFIEEIKKIRGWENTLFIITSDHGQGLNDHPDVYRSHTHGNLLYESHQQVPLIFYHTGNKSLYKPHRVKERVQLMDLMPTILDYLGIELPGDHDIDGKSLLYFLTGSGARPQLPEYFVVETGWREVNKIGVYSAEWKYIENRDEWKGVNLRELQRMGITENGILTDEIDQEPGTGKKMKHFLSQWEQKYKRAPRILPKGKLTNKEIDQLKALGYLN